MKESLEVSSEERNNYYKVQEELRRNISKNSNLYVCDVYSNGFPFITAAMSIHSKYIDEVREIILSRKDIFEITYEYTFLAGYYFNVLVKVKV
jgi:hypothetical protein